MYVLGHAVVLGVSLPRPGYEPLEPPIPGGFSTVAVVQRRRADTCPLRFKRAQAGTTGGERRGTRCTNGRARASHAVCRKNGA